jgi:hypothetical protein
LFHQAIEVVDRCDIGLGDPMRQVLLMALASAGVAGIVGASVSEPAAFAVVLAGIAGSGFLGRPKTKQSIHSEE